MMQIYAEELFDQVVEDYQDRAHLDEDHVHVHDFAQFLLLENSHQKIRPGEAG